MSGSDPSTDFNNAYVVRWFPSNGAIKQFLIKSVAGSNTSLDTNNDTLGSPQSMDVQADGSSITGNVGTSSLSATDSALTGDLQCGVRLFPLSTVTSWRLDAHTMEDVAAGGPVGIVVTVLGDIQ